MNEWTIIGGGLGRGIVAATLLMCLHLAVTSAAAPDDLYPRISEVEELPGVMLVELSEDDYYLDFSQSQFGTEHLTVGELEPETYEPDPDTLAATVAFIKSWNKNVDAETTAKNIILAQSEYPLVPLELALEIIARESRFDPTAHNTKTNCYGYWQLMSKYHRGPLEKCGWHWTDPLSNLRYGFKHIQDWLNERKVYEQSQVTPQLLYRAIWPWEVRPSAYAAWRAR